MKNIVILTGAGISAESGIHTYRDNDGLWTKNNPTEVCHINGWQTDPKKLLNFQNELRNQFFRGNYRPNAAHMAIKELQDTWTNGTVTVVTQNIDGLHENTGTETYAIHGTGMKKFCEACNYISDYDADINHDHECDNCRSVGTTRPNVVFFGEMPHYLEIIEEKLKECHYFIAIGTSGDVYPAAGMVDIAANNKYGAKTILINKEPIDNDFNFEVKIYGNATEKVPAVLTSLKNGIL